MKKCRSLSDEERIHYYWALRSARTAAFADAENYQQILFVIERLGSHLLGEIKTLYKYQPCLKQLAEKSLYSHEVPKHKPSWHSSFDNLFEVIRDARNDAFHQGVIARHLTSNLVLLSLLLEDALMGGKRRKWADVMIRQVIVAQPWQPISYVRQQMLTYSVTYLPIKLGEGWKLISDYEVAAYINRGSSSDRKTRLVESVEEASSKGLHLLDAKVCSPKNEIDTAVMRELDGKLIIIVDKNNNIVGVVSPFDIL